MSEEIDPILAGILNEIEGIEPEPDPDEPDDEPDEPDEPDLESSLEDSNYKSFDDIEEQEEIIGDDNTVIISNSITNEQLRMQEFVFGLVEKHSDSASKMFEEADVDRKKVDTVIDILLPKIESDEYRHSDIGAIASLLQTKADISRNRASMMDSIAKLFASIKNNDSIARPGNDESISTDDINRFILDD